MAPVNEILGLAPDAWQVIGTIATSVGVLTAGGAAAVAAKQYRQSKDAALDATRPYVVITFEPSLNWGSFDIVVRNVGSGPARDVTIASTPQLERATSTRHVSPIHEALFFNQPTPLMPPGYELATFFDRLSERDKTDLPKRYTFTVTYNDGHGHEWTEENICDLALIDDLLFTEELRVHHVAYALRELRDVVKRSPLLAGEVDALIETRPERAQREEDERHEHRRLMEKRREAAEAAEAESGASE